MRGKAIAKAIRPARSFESRPIAEAFAVEGSEVLGASKVAVIVNVVEGKSMAVVMTRFNDDSDVWSRELEDVALALDDSNGIIDGLAEGSFPGGLEGGRTFIHRDHKPP